MSHLENLTPFPGTALPSMTKDDVDVVLVLCAATFALPSGSASSLATIAEIQRDLTLTDEYFGEPGESSLKREGQSAYTRLKTDITIVGDAWSESPTTQHVVSARIGDIESRLIVFGPRTWQPNGLGDLTPTPPQSFTRLPLRYEYAFGGVSKTDGPPLYEARNPVGMGFYRDATEAEGQPLACIEDPSALVQTVRDRPRPAGFAPVARHWQPRLSLAGTYDEQWKETRAPLWPRDFDERFFNAAPAPLQATIQPGRRLPISLSGLYPGDFAFEIDVPRIEAELRRPNERESATLDLRSLEIDLDAEYLQLTLGGIFPLPEGPATPHHISLRVLESWEAT